jgi:3-dehydroquinate synthetase
MRAVLHLALEPDSVDPELVDLVNRLLDGFDLPRTAQIDRSVVLKRMSSDKKRVAGRQRWVMPVPGGGVAIRQGIDEEAVLRALDTVTDGPATRAEL